jgi:hypothetical protein
VPSNRRGNIFKNRVNLSQTNRAPEANVAEQPHDSLARPSENFAGVLQFVEQRQPTLHR